MILNSLFALTIGFVLDMLFGDPSAKIYPLNLVKRMVVGLENALRKAYQDSPEAQRAAGGMLVLLTVIICVGVSIALLFICYSISSVLGIIMEGLLCWNAISIRALRSGAASVTRCVRAGNIESAQKKLGKITFRDTDDLDSDDIIKCAVESVSENTVDWVAAPIFWICLFGGVGGILYRVINILDNTVGYKTERCRYFGSIPAKLDDVLTFIPARICALLMKMNVAFLHLDSKNAGRIYKRDRKKSPSPNSGQTMSVCAGALGISISGDEYYEGQLVRKNPIGNNLRDVNPNDIYWANQLLNGTSAYCFLLAAFFRASVFFILK